MRVELKRIQRELGATIVYVTHDQLEATTLADCIGVPSAGWLVQIAGPREIYERPTNIYAAPRLGSPTINLLPAGALDVRALCDSAESRDSPWVANMIHPAGWAGGQRGWQASIRRICGIGLLMP